MKLNHESSDTKVGHFSLLWGKKNENGILLFNWPKNINPNLIFWIYVSSNVRLANLQRTPFVSVFVSFEIFSALSRALGNRFTKRAILFVIFGTSELFMPVK